MTSATSVIFKHVYVFLIGLVFLNSNSYSLYHTMHHITLARSVWYVHISYFEHTMTECHRSVRTYLQQTCVKSRQLLWLVSHDALQFIQIQITPRVWVCQDNVGNKTNGSTYKQLPTSLTNTSTIITFGKSRSTCNAVIFNGGDIHVVGW